MCRRAYTALGCCTVWLMGQMQSDRTESEGADELHAHAEPEPPQVPAGASRSVNDDTTQPCKLLLRNHSQSIVQLTCEPLGLCAGLNLSLSLPSIHD